MKKILVIIGLVAVIGLSYAMYSKAHTIRYCRVTQEHDKVITVLHPNGETYDFYALNSGEYIEDTIIKVSFNELKFDKQDYTVNASNPKEYLQKIELKDHVDDSTYLQEIKRRY